MMNGMMSRDMMWGLGIVHSLILVLVVLLVAALLKY